MSWLRQDRLRMGRAGELGGYITTDMGTDTALG